MKIINANLQKNYYPNRQITFEHNLFARTYSPKKLESISDGIAMLLNDNTSHVQNTIQDAAKKRISLFRLLAEKYNRLNFYIKPEDRENITNIFDIFNMVKKPLQEHFGVVHDVRGSFKELKEIFELAKDKKSLKFIQRLHSDVLKDKPDTAHIVKEMLQSPYFEEFEKHPGKYVSYLKLNLDNPKAVEELNNLIASGKFNRRDFDIKYSVTKLIHNNRKYLERNPHITQEALEQNYSREGVEFLDAFINNYYAHKDVSVIPEINSKNVMEMYKSANKDNIGIRVSLLNALKYSPKVDSKGNDLVQPEIARMYQLFDRADNDKNVRQFLEKTTQGNIGFESFDQINNLIDTYGAKKLNIFFDNFARIMNKADASELDYALSKGLTDPTFETRAMRHKRKDMEHYKFIEKEGKFSKIIKQIQNRYNEYRYNRVADGEYSPIKADYDIVPVQEIKTEKVADIKTKAIKPQIEEPIIEQPVVEHIEQSLVEQEQPIVASIAPERSLVLARKLKELPAVKKFKVISDVNDTINKSLKKSVVDKQKAEYLQNATKMRLKVLPDIFESIKETRKADRLAGKKHSRSSNSDAVTLYKLINGKNRKLVNYMLKQTDAEGKRIFEVKDIIATVKKAEAETAKMKAKDKTFKSADKKAYYDAMFDEMVEKYGKLPAKRRTK